MSTFLVFLVSVVLFVPISAKLAAPRGYPPRNHPPVVMTKRLNAQITRDLANVQNCNPELLPPHRTNIAACALILHMVLCRFSLWVAFHGAFRDEKHCYEWLSQPDNAYYVPVILDCFYAEDYSNLLDYCEDSF